MAAAQGGRKVVADLRAELASYGAEAAKILQLAVGVLEAEGLLGKKMADMYLSALVGAGASTEGEQGRVHVDFYCGGT